MEAGRSKATPGRLPWLEGRRDTIGGVTPTRSWCAAAALVLLGCGGGAPRDPHDGPRGHDPSAPPEYADDRPARRADDPWSIEAQLPRSGDPARPNVKVEVQVVDVVSRQGLRVRASLAGRVVRGVVDLRAGLSAGGGSSRARSRTSTFVVVQAGREAEVALSQESRWLVGPYQALWVHVVRAGPDGAEVDVAPVSPTARPGEAAALATRVFVRPGEAVLLGGVSEERQGESRGLGRHDEASERRELVALLLVDVLG